MSREGTLVYVPALADASRSLVWVDRNGRETPTTAPDRVYNGPCLSPDGTRVAVVVGDVGQHIHVFDFARETLSRLTIGSGIDELWTADTKHVVFSSQRGGVSNLYAEAAAGTGRVYRLTTSPNWQTPGWVAPDGTGIVGSRGVVPGQVADT